jgi:hypothetical protein
MLKRQRMIHQTDSECHTTWTLDSAARYHYCIELHTESAWYSTLLVLGAVYHTVSARYTALSVHGIPHSECTVFHQLLHGVLPRQLTDIRQQQPKPSGEKFKGGGEFQTTV